jgi:hypothetical protein
LPVLTRPGSRVLLKGVKMKTKTAVEKIREILEKSPYKTGDDIRGEFTLWKDGSVELTIGCASYLFTEEGDLLLTVTPREVNNFPG